MRLGFTLVELLVVIAIIGILASLLLVAFNAMGPSYEAQTRADIAQLSVAIQAFETYFKVPYIPSRIILCNSYASYFNPVGQPWTPLHADSLNYLQRVFPRLTSGPWTGSGINWNGSNSLQDPPISLSVYDPSAGAGGMVNCYGYALEGEQCLVFFLGGVPQANADGTFTATGFSTNPGDPTQPGGGRIGPFFDFQSPRLIHWSPSGQPPGYSGTAAGFPSYLDGYGKTPYAYFSAHTTSEGQSNGYNRYVNYSNPYLELHTPPAGCGPVTTDCQALPFAQGQFQQDSLGVFPYAQSMGAGATPIYLNPRTFQIISAGKDYCFGTGTVICSYPGGPPRASYWSGSPLWSAANASAVYPAGQRGGHDDISNFHDRLLGVSSQ